MAQAGFVYTPQAAGDDTVTCLYCNLSLGGWETEDDPVYGSVPPYANNVSKSIIVRNTVGGTVNLGLPVLS